MSQVDRLQTEIVLTSPDGDAFYAKWVGNDVTMERRVTQFSYPGQNGIKAQDFGTGPAVYPLNVYFDGEDNDTEAARFFRSCGQSGLWGVTHPIKGELSLQLLSVKEKVFPLESMLYTGFELKFVEDILSGTVVSWSHQRAKNNIKQTVYDLNDAATDDFTNNVPQNTALQKQGVTKAINGAVNSVRDNLAKIYKPIATLNAEMDTIYSGLTSSLSDTVLDLTGIAGQTVNFIQLPSAVAEDLTVRLSAYGEVLSDSYDFSFDEDDYTNQIKPEASIINAAKTQEFVTVSTIGAMALSIVSGDIKTRANAVSIMDNLKAAFYDSVAELDKTQSFLIDKTINKQYFTETYTFSLLHSLVGQTLEYVLRSIFDLAIEKTYVLDRPRATIEFVISEYGGIGENDSNYDGFIALNTLEGNEVLLLPMGKEVKVYVE